MGNFRKAAAKMVTGAIVGCIATDGLLLYSMEHRFCQAAIDLRGAQLDLR